MPARVRREFIDESLSQLRLGFAHRKGAQRRQADLLVRRPGLAIRSAREGPGDCDAGLGAALAAAGRQHNGGGDERESLELEEFGLRRAGDAAGGATARLRGNGGRGAAAFDAAGRESAGGASSEAGGLSETLGGRALIDPGTHELDFVGVERGLVYGRHVLVVAGREHEARQHEAGFAIFGHDAGAAEATFQELSVFLDAEAAGRLFADVALAAFFAQQRLYGVGEERDLRGQALQHRGVGGTGDVGGGDGRCGACR
jgi:hypothetical protein